MRKPVRGAAFGQGAVPTIACMNKATVPLGVDFAALIAALQKCYDQYFLPIWGYPVRLQITNRPAASMWQFVFLDDADAADALGYHDLTSRHQPISKIFVKTTLAAGELVSVTACHELFEMAVDPGANIWAQGPGGAFYAYEMSDAVEEETFDVDGIAMSDFVHPAFFEPWTHPKGTKFDHLGLVTKPFQTLKGGYQIVSDAKGVHEVFGSKSKKRRFAREDRRMHRGEVRKTVHRPNFARPGDADE
jgi:hypothetical protein